jgi:hypothetical protein
MPPTSDRGDGFLAGSDTSLAPSVPWFIACLVLQAGRRVGSALSLRS